MQEKRCDIYLFPLGFHVNHILFERATNHKKIKCAKCDSTIHTHTPKTLWKTNNVLSIINTFCEISQIHFVICGHFYIMLQSFIAISTTSIQEDEWCHDNKIFIMMDSCTRKLFKIITILVLFGSKLKCKIIFFSSIWIIGMKRNEEKASRCLCA